MEVKFSIPTIIVEPTLDVAQNAIGDVALAILDANRSMYTVKILNIGTYQSEQTV